MLVTNSQARHLHMRTIGSDICGIGNSNAGKEGQSASELGADFLRATKATKLLVSNENAVLRLCWFVKVVEPQIGQKRRGVYTHSTIYNKTRKQALGKQRLH